MLKYNRKNKEVKRVGYLLFFLKFDVMVVKYPIKKGIISELNKIRSQSYQPYHHDNQTGKVFTVRLDWYLGCDRTVYVLIIVK